MVNCDENHIISRILQLQNDESETMRNSYLREIKTHHDRLSMLDKLIEKLYEDRLNGVLPEATFKSLIEKFEQERIDRSQSAETLEKRVKSIRQNTEHAKTWATLIKGFSEIEKLNQETLLLLIDKIQIGETKKVDGFKFRDVKIIYNYVGDINFLTESTEMVAAYG